jgi:hypothetical protein
MADDDAPDDAGYPVSMRAAAAFGLLLVGALAWVLLDVLSGGKLAGCADCQDKADASA